MKTLLALLLLATTAAAQPANVARVVLGNERGWGSGSLITADKVLTAYHVVDDVKGYSQIMVHFPGKDPIGVVAIKVDKAWDLAILTLADAPEGLEPFIFAAEPPAVGDSLTIGGYGPDCIYEEDCGTLSYYAGPGFGYPDEWIVVEDADARPGDSGGPIINTEGHLVGCLWGSRTDPPETVGSGLERILEFCR